MQRNAQRQARFDTADVGIQVFAQRDDIAAFLHRHAYPYSGHALKAHLRLVWIGIAAFDVGHILEQHRAFADLDWQLGDLVDATETPGRAQVDAVAGGFKAASGVHAVPLLQSVDDVLRAETQIGELLVGQINVDLFVLHADDIDLGHTRHAQQFLAQIVGGVAQLRHAETVAGQREYIAEGFAEIVVEKRPLHALRQAALDIADTLAYLIEKVRHVAVGRVVLRGDKQLRLARTRKTFNRVDMRCFEQGFFNPVGYQQFHLLGCGTRPVGLHQHHLEGERRVLGLPQFAVGHDAQHGQQHHCVEHEIAVPQRPFRQVETTHKALPLVALNGIGVIF